VSAAFADGQFRAPGGGFQHGGEVDVSGDATLAEVGGVARGDQVAGRQRGLGAVVVDLGIAHGGGVPVACRIDRPAILQPATGLAASHGALYKFVVGGAARLLFCARIAISSARRGLPARRMHCAKRRPSS